MTEVHVSQRPADKEHFESTEIAVAVEINGNPIGNLDGAAHRIPGETEVHRIGMGIKFGVHCAPQVSRELLGNWPPSSTPAPTHAAPSSITHALTYTHSTATITVPAAPYALPTLAQPT